MARRIAKLAGIVVSCAALLGLSTASAGAAASRPSVLDAFGKGVLCDTTEQHLCWAGHDGENGTITAKAPPAGVAGVAEEMSVTKDTKKCNGGQVTETCPFTEGSDLNAYYAGDDIVTLLNYDNHMTYHFNGGISEKTSVTDGTQFWVQVGSFEGGHSGMLVNVYDSDQRYASVGPDQACWAESPGAAGDDLAMWCGQAIKTVDTSPSQFDWTDLGS